MTWTPERVERLTHLWNELGWSARRIERDMGCSRNAIIGKAHRLGLKARPNPIVRKGIAERATPPPELPVITDRLSKAVEGDGTVRRIAPPAPVTRPCLWPGVQPRDPDDYAGCTAQALEGRPYCAEHCARAYSRKSEAA